MLNNRRVTIIFIYIHYYIHYYIIILLSIIYYNYYIYILLYTIIMHPCPIFGPMKSMNFGWIPRPDPVICFQEERLAGVERLSTGALFFFRSERWRMMDMWVCLKMVSTQKNPLVLLIIIPFLNGYFIGKIPNISRQTHVIRYEASFKKKTKVTWACHHFITLSVNFPVVMSLSLCQKSQTGTGQLHPELLRAPSCWILAIFTSLKLHVTLIEKIFSKIRHSNFTIEALGVIHIAHVCTLAELMKLGKMDSTKLCIATIIHIGQLTVVFFLDVQINPKPLVLQTKQIICTGIIPSP